MKARRTPFAKRMEQCGYEIHMGGAAPGLNPTTQTAYSGTYVWMTMTRIGTDLLRVSALSPDQIQRKHSFACNRAAPAAHRSLGESFVNRLMANLTGGWRRPRHVSLASPRAQWILLFGDPEWFPHPVRRFVSDPLRRSSFRPHGIGGGRANVFRNVTLARGIKAARTAPGKQAVTRGRRSRRDHYYAKHPRHSRARKPAISNWRDSGYRESSGAIQVHRTNWKSRA